MKGIIRSGDSFNFHLCCLDLKGLLCLGSCHKLSGNDYGRAHVKLANIFEIFKLISENYLERFEEGSVIYHNKSEGLGIPDGTHPASHGNFLSYVLVPVSENLLDVNYFFLHFIFPPLLIFFNNYRPPILHRTGQLYVHADDILQRRF